MLAGERIPETTPLDRNGISLLVPPSQPEIHEKLIALFSTRLRRKVGITETSISGQ